jgi:PAS domain S-box-containing protein
VTRAQFQPTLKQAGELYEAQKRLLQQISDGAPLTQMLEALVREIELRAPGMIASVLLLEDDRLRYGAAPSLPDGYNRAADGHPIGEGMGSCGTAAYRREAVIVSDIQTDPLWSNYREIAARYELGACWSVPIMTASRELVLGTFALYHREPRTPRPEELWLVGEFSQLARVAIEHRRVRDRLLKSERRSAQLMSDLDAIAWEAAVETRRCLYIDARAEEMLGYPAESWLSERDFWRQRIHEEDREAIAKRWLQAARSRRGYDCEYRMLAGDGRIVWIREVGYAPPPDSDGYTPRVHGVLVNISRQREAEQAREELLQQLVREQELVRAVVQQMPQGVIVAAAPSGQILMVNDQVERIARRRVIPLQPIEQHWSQIHRPDGSAYDPAEWPIWRALRKGEVVVNEELELFRGDGTYCTLSVSTAPLRDRQGGIIAGVVVFSDITARKHGERARRFLADAGAALLGSLDGDATISGVAALAAREFADWCLVFRASDDGELRCVTVEHRDPLKAAGVAAALDGLVQQPGGTPFGLSAVMATGGSRLFSDVSADSFEPGAVRTQLMQLVREMGVRSAITVSIGQGAHVVDAVVYCSTRDDHRYDVADLAVAEELARRSALALDNARLYREAQTAVKLREQFLSIAAHELRTPLGALQLVLQSMLLQLGKPEVNLGVIGERARAGERQCKRFARLVDELLDVSRIQFRQMRIEPEEMDLRDAIGAVIARFHEELVHKGIDVALHAPVPVMGKWDRLRMEQVFTNLLSNALKYGQGRPVRIAVNTDEDLVQVSLQDEGIGMSRELIQNLFRPFERGVATGEYGGLGLGLYITDQIVRAHGGKLRVHSVPGQGSTFTVVVPRSCDQSFAGAAAE